MKKIKLFALLTLGIAAMTGCAVSNQNGNNVPKNNVSDRLAFQATTSLSALSSLQTYDMPNIMAKKVEVDDQTKEEIESLLPTLSLIVENDKNFSSEVMENTDAGKENYKFKQVITLTDLSNESLVYTLYYNIDNEKISDDIVADLPTNDNSENATDSTDQITVKSAKEEAEDDENDEDDEEEKLDQKDNTKKEEKEEEEDDDDDDELDRHGEEKTSVTVFNGIATKDNIDYPFEARSTEEVEDEEVEKVFALRIFATNEQDENNYIDVVYENEQEDNEIEKTYKYTFVEGGVKVKEFEIELENKQNDKLTENEIEIKLGDKEFEFNIETDSEGKTVITVEFENDGADQEYAPLQYVLATTEDGNVIFEEVVSK